MKSRFLGVAFLIVITLMVALASGHLVSAAGAPQQPAAVSTAEVSPQRALLDQYCVTCHSERIVSRPADPDESLQITQLRNVGLTLDTEDVTNVAANPEVWEKVVRKLRVGAMPPPPRPRPDQATYDRFRARLESELDHAAAANPDPGRTQAFHRLNRMEYRNVIRDLFDLDIDVSELIPADAPDEHGFDNNAGALSFSPALLERYISAAHKISRLALGVSPAGPVSTTYDVPLNLMQDDRLSEDLPFGSRGGVAINHTFPVDGLYRIKVKLQTNYVQFVRGLDDPHDIEISLDGARLEQFTIGGEAPGVPAPYSFAGNIRGDDAWESYQMRFSDAGLVVEVPVKAGPRIIGATFPRERWEDEGVLQPRQQGFALAVNDMPDTNPRVGSIEITGPLTDDGPGDTPSRRRILICRPATPADEPGCATEILSSLARRAYRRPVTDDDVATLIEFYEAGRQEGGFESGIQFALERLLTSPDLLLRIERDPVDATPDTAYPVSDVELASRLSFFLWSSLPDEELLALAEEDTLSEPAVLARQVRRMLADDRAAALIEGFVGQWLYLRNLASVYPTPSEFREFDENLRQAFQQETELFIDYQLRADRSVLELLSADYTFVNERLARHYGIAGVNGSRFRRVNVEGDRQAGLLGHASLMTVTSYPNRTSPVLRGKFVLENLLGAPPPEPPPNVPALEETDADGKPRSLREAMVEHRENPACRVCHATMDPIGFSLENFDAIGAWRTTFAGKPIDTSGVLPDGGAFDGPTGLRDMLLARPADFVGTVTEKLMTYALGRGVQYYDMPTVRRIVREAEAVDYRWSAIILGIIKSAPFQMRRSES
ncbi:MAG: DUF1592 domain-containing protein [Acidobacteria bacterium]|nr:MAG: DUF1592 domain-containing protein [Acidobacteriota bacterium]